MLKKTQKYNTMTKIHRNTAKSLCNIPILTEYSDYDIIYLQERKGMEMKENITKCFGDFVSCENTENFI